jgi:CIC family chloride channel protein
MTEHMALPDARVAAELKLAPEPNQTLKAENGRGRPFQVLNRLRRVRLGQLFLFFSVLVGLASGLLVVCFQVAIGWTRLWLLGSALAPSHARVILVPTVAGLVVAFLVIRVFPRVRGGGVNQTKAAVYISGGQIPFSTVVGKFICCALAIGSGPSLGPEGPVPADRGGIRLGAWTAAAALTRQVPLDRASGRCCRLGGRL